MIVLIDDQRVFQERITRLHDPVVIRTLPEVMSWLEGLNEKSIIHQLWIDDDMGSHEGITIDTFLSELERRIVQRDRAPYVETLITYKGTKALTALAGRVGRVLNVEENRYFVSS